MASKREYHRARYAAFLKAGLCAQCGRERAPHDARLCAHCREVRRANGLRDREANRIRPTGVKSPPRRPDEPPREAERIRCQVCCDQPWRRPAGGCVGNARKPGCGEPHGEAPVLTLAEVAERRDGTWRERA